MKTIDLHPGTGLRVFRCMADELHPDLLDSEFPVFYLGWGRYNQESKRVCILFDTRYLDPLSVKTEQRLSLGPELQIVVHTVIVPVEAALVVDLGNTRSFAMLLDDWRQGRSMQIQPLKLQDYSSETDTYTRSGVFWSHVCLERLSRVEANNGASDYGRPLSPVRTGFVAQALMDQAAHFDHRPEGRFSQVSPKRFFWDHDPARFKWKAVCQAEKRWVSTGDLLLESWLADRNIPSDNMPPSTLIGAMVTELLEQAEMQLNANAENSHATAVGPRRISHIAITYPPAWTQQERCEYREVIQRHLRAYCSQRALRMPTVHVSCDEGTASLLAYVSNEVEKFGGNLLEWVASVGVVDSQEGNGGTRIAVLDVGGGTTDLIIADVRVLSDSHGMPDLQIRRLHQDGVSVAGDEILRRVAVRIVLPAVAAALCPEDLEARQSLFNHMLSRPTPDEALRQLRGRWAQQLWFPMALRVMQAWQQKGGKVDVGTLETVTSFCHSCIKFIADLKLERLLFQLGTDDEPNNGAIARAFASLQPQPDTIQDICSEVFADAVQRFSLPIALADCDLLLLVGKTTEFKVVRDEITRSIPLPASRIVSFHKYSLASRWINAAGRDGTRTLDDVKMTTVMGATLHLCNHLGIPAFGLASNPELLTDAYHFSDSQHFWGIVSPDSAMPTFKNEHAVFRPGDGRQTAQVEFRLQSLLLARRRTALEDMTAQIAYELRVRPDLLGIPAGVVEIERVVEADGSVRLSIGQSVGGSLRFADGMTTQLKADHLELRTMVAQSSDFWVFEGNFHEVVDWDAGSSLVQVSQKGRDK